MSAVASVRRVKIGIDARAAAEEPAGRGRYLRELLRHLSELEDDHAFILYARRPWDTEGLDARFRWSLISVPDPLWHVLAAYRASRECDVFLSTNSYLTPWFVRVPCVIIVFDMIAFNARARPQRRASLIERMTLRRAVTRAAAVAAISEATKRDLVARHPSADAKTALVYPAASAAFSSVGAGDEEILRRHELRRPYVLSAGTFEPRKNLPRLIEAFSALPDHLQERHELVLVGPKGWETDEILASIAAHRGAVRALGYVDEGDLPALYRRAELFCYPSLYEGFGLPVLEAMRCGTAVITANVSSLPEVGGEAVRYVDPLDVEEIRAALADLLEHPEKRRELAERGSRRAEAFDWRITAARMLELLERQAPQPPRSR